MTILPMLARGASAGACGPYDASEEAETKVEQENWDNEGGHTSSTASTVVSTPRREMSYQVVLTHEAEASIRRNPPRQAGTLHIV